MPHGLTRPNDHTVPSHDITSHDTHAIGYRFAPKIGFVAGEKVYRTDARSVAESWNGIGRTLRSRELA